jgi:arginase
MAELPDHTSSVTASKDAFDLALSYPQWQGSGRPANLQRGALAAAEVCGRYAPLRRVDSAGEGTAAGGIHRWTAIVEQFCSAQQILREVQPRRVLTAGGDCAVDIAVIDFLHRQYPDLTVVWVDAHLDSNTSATSPSGNFHGMPVAAILGAAPPALQRLLGQALSPSRFFYVSAHVGDPGEWEFQREHALQWWELDRQISGPVHLHFDLDVLHPAEFPFVAYQDGRMSMDAGVDVVRRLASAGELVGLTITEFAPADMHEAAQGSRYISRLCEAACSRSTTGW